MDMKLGGGESRLPSYVVITPARNEARCIEQTIQDVIAQTVRPMRWVIVSDGSTDGTDEIVRRYMGDHPWIQLMRMPERVERNFAGKAHAFNAGYAAIKELRPDVIGNLDADVSVGPEHFEYLLTKRCEDNELGIWGAPFREGDERYDYRFTSIESVWGGCQLICRECLEDIGGYTPLKGGLVDHVAVVTARMKGWKTRTFVESVCVHQRVMGTANRSVMGASFDQGVKDFAAGNDPVWETFRVIYQMRNKPFVFGALALAAGFINCSIHRPKRSVTPELMAFTRREQRTRLKRLFRLRGQSEPVIRGKAG
ncbi:MAG: glycosyltransferase family 2 protein [Candidatus Korobacteraceae bacterium]|jgi:glycosyltransferase involved in cell wall biosynthesis